MSARAYLPWLRVVKALRIAVFQMDGDTPIASSEVVREASSFPQGLYLGWQGKSLLFNGSALAPRAYLQPVVINVYRRGYRDYHFRYNIASYVAIATELC